MRDSWGAYVLSAWGQDELMPVSGQGTRAFCDTGALLQLTMAATATACHAQGHTAWSPASVWLRPSAQWEVLVRDVVAAAMTGATWACAGATLLDALDTLWIMDMKQEFARARDWVAYNLTMDEYVLQASHRFQPFLVHACRVSQTPVHREHSSQHCPSSKHLPQQAEATLFRLRGQNGTSAAPSCRDCQTSLFELVIRGVGGLLSAYDLSQDPILLDK